MKYEKEIKLRSYHIG